MLHENSNMDSTVGAISGHEDGNPGAVKLGSSSIPLMAVSLSSGRLRRNDYKYVNYF